MNVGQSYLPQKRMILWHIEMAMQFWKIHMLGRNKNEKNILSKSRIPAQAIGKPDGIHGDSPNIEDAWRWKQYYGII